MQTKVYNLENKPVGEIELPEVVFGVKWNPAIVHQVLLAQLANRRRPWAHAKDRSEVRGGGRKPWRQKGTGRARHGSIRSPIWRGGGKAHGPLKERDYSQKINKKMRRQAILSVLSKKVKDGEFKVFENFEVKDQKTKELAKILKPLVALKKKAKNYDVLLVPAPENKALSRPIANLPKAKALSPTNLNVYDLLNYKNIFVEKDAVSAIATHYKAK